MKIFLLVPFSYFLLFATENVAAKKIKFLDATGDYYCQKTPKILKCCEVSEKGKKWKNSEQCQRLMIEAFLQDNKKYVKRY